MRGQIFCFIQIVIVLFRQQVNIVHNILQQNTEDSACPEHSAEEHQGFNVSETFSRRTLASQMVQCVFWCGGEGGASDNQTCDWPTGGVLDPIHRIQTRNILIKELCC